jgi:hypothetical protein
MDSIDRFLLFVATPTVFALSLTEALVLSRRQHCNWRSDSAAVPTAVAQVPATRQ